jgi:hypothetical protein
MCSLMDVLPGQSSGIILRQETGNEEWNAMPARVFTLEIATKTGLMQSPLNQGQLQHIQESNLDSYEVW